MSWTAYFIILAGCALSMLASRVIPLFVLKGRTLPPRVEKTIGFIPPAAFAALVANDLADIHGFAAGGLAVYLPLIAAVPVAFVAVRTKSLAWSAVTGVVVLALLTLLAGML